MLKAPPVQTATATIDTLSSRLQSATLLEDRRAAILGLRSFAKQYPASVASGSLRELIATLRKDGLGQVSQSRKGEDGSGDVDTIRLVLETLLMLFNPDENSPEAGEEIGLFMADEFAMRQDNLGMLLLLLDPTSPYADYYSRLYSVQILSAICTSRPERLQECILSAPLGVSRVVGILDDGRDAVRNAGLLLLVDLTGGANEELRKIVAFEDVFTKVFGLIQLEGGLAEAGITAQDCLSLLANLVRGSASNQAMFRESQCVPQMCRLLAQVVPSEDETPFLAQNREKAGWGLLQLLRLFVVAGEPSAPLNQQAFYRAGAVQTLVDLGFTTALPTPIRAAALKCASELIQNNAPLQEAFATLTVVTTPTASEPAAAAVSSRSHTPSQTNGIRSVKGSARPSKEYERHPIIEALLELSLSQVQADTSLRATSCGLVQAYLTRHNRIKAHFLQRAIAGHTENESAANVLNTILVPGGDAASLTFASWIVQDLVIGADEAKFTLASVKEGDEEEDEEVVTAIQSIGSRLQAALQLKPVDERVASSLMSLLFTLLWEFAEGVNDLLDEGSSVLQSLVLAINQGSDTVSSGLAASLLGTIYEFSTKDSPIPRRTLAPLLTQRLGRSSYLDALLQFRRDPSVRDFGLSEPIDAEGVVSSTFVELFMTEYSRLRKAIDKDPGVEVLPVSAAEAGVDRDILDTLRQEAKDAKNALSTAQAEALSASQSADQDKLSREKEIQGLSAEVERLRKINQAIQAGHENEVQELREQHAQQSQTMASQHQRVIADTKQKIESQSRQVIDAKANEIARLASAHEQKLAEVRKAHEAEKVEHGNTRRQLQEFQTAREQAENEMRALKSTMATLQNTNNELRKHANNLESQLRAGEMQISNFTNELEAASKQIKIVRKQYAELEEQLKDKEEEVKARDAELETERKGFGDLEAELETAKASYASLQDALKEAEQSKTEMQDQLVALRSTQAETQKSLDAASLSQAETEKSLDLLRSEQEKVLTNRTRNSDNVDQMQEELKALKSELEKAKTELEKAKHDADEARKSSKDSAKGTSGKNDKKLKELEGAKAAAEKAEKQIARLQKEAEVRQKLIETLKAQAEKAQTELEDAQKESEAVKADLDATKTDFDALQKTLQAASEGEKSAKEELESMLLVMGDIETKRDEYKAKVKELGGQISEDDDEDEDEEDEEDDEDGDVD